MNLKDLREQRNLTQKELERKLGVTTTVVSKWETGKARPRYETLPKLAELLGVSVEQLLECFEK